MSSPAVPGGTHPWLLDVASTLRWVQTMLGRIARASKERHIQTSIDAVAHALDARTNPRLGKSEKRWTLPRVPRTANWLIRKHWGRRRRERETWRKLVRAVCGRPPRKVTGKVVLHIVVHRHTRQDPDNAYASVKRLLDALVHEGWLEDDGPDHLVLGVTEEVERRRKHRRTEITWIPADPVAAGDEERGGEES